MSTFEDDRYQWRETYFILFNPSKRPLIGEVRKKLKPLLRTLKLTTIRGDSEGRLEMLSIASPEDHAALDIAYQSGEHILEEMNVLADELVNLTSTKKNQEKIERIRTCSARLEVLHFEQMVSEENENPPEVFSPQNRESSPENSRDAFSSRPRFQFDPDHYIEPPIISQPRTRDEMEEEEPEEDSDPVGELDPNTLLLVLEIFCRLTDGVAIDPASGAVL